MIILGIETSCDETACAVLQKQGDRVTILSNIIASSASLQSKYGGIIPEQAAREQLKSIIPVIEEALRLASLAQGNPSTPRDLDAIAVTYGPGLIGSLLVGVETAKTLALLWNKPLIPVNHLIGHFYANWITSVIPTRFDARRAKVGIHTNNHLWIPDQVRDDKGIPQFPCIGLLVSGGHTDLVLFKEHGKYEYLGGTRDDAAGECFDKCARILGLPYPGGPQISELASKGDAFKTTLPSPLIHSKDFDFSFSGLKTAVANVVSEELRKTQSLSESFRKNLCASIEKSIVDVLVKKTVAAAQKYKVDQIIVAGGVAANQELVNRLQGRVDSLGIKLYVPEPKLCTDNAAMIASAAFFQENTINPLQLQANPNLSLNLKF